VEFIEYSEDEASRYEAAERFVGWLEHRVIGEARGDTVHESPVDPTGRFWLGRLGPKDVVTLPDDRADRLEPCAIGLKLRPNGAGPWTFTVLATMVLWARARAEGGGLRWKWSKTEPVSVETVVTVPDEVGEFVFGAAELTTALTDIGGEGLSGELRVRVAGRPSERYIEVTLVNTSGEPADLADGRFFECSVQVSGLPRRDFELEALPDSFRFDRRVPAYGINCGGELIDEVVRTSDGPSFSRNRPDFWTVEDSCPNLAFDHLGSGPSESARALLRSLEKWRGDHWSAESLNGRADEENWSAAMRTEADAAAEEFEKEVERVRRGCELLDANASLRRAFQLMNRAMLVAANGKYDRWRPFQLGFLLANLQSLVDSAGEADTVDIVWFATGGGKTETYLGLLLTAAFLDRLRGKTSGVTAWSRFPLRLLSLQQTQRFANALAAAEIVRQDEQIDGDPFSLGFLVGSGATPNRIKKESERETEDADKLEDMENPCRLLDTCPFCRNRTVRTEFDRRSWRLVHVCSSEGCRSGGDPLPIYVIDDEIWRFLPTVVIGTLDTAANISRQSGMRGLVGPPWGMCRREGN
jgi:hypothetical protein